MDNKEVIDQAVKLYFQGGNWHKYLKEQVKKEKDFKELPKNIFEEEQ